MKKQNSKKQHKVEEIAEPSWNAPKLMSALREAREKGARALSAFISETWASIMKCTFPKELENEPFLAVRKMYYTLLKESGVEMNVLQREVLKAQRTSDIKDEETRFLLDLLQRSAYNGEAAKDAVDRVNKTRRNKMSENGEDRRKRGEIFGYAVTRVIMWVASKGYSVEDARKVCAHFGHGDVANGTLNTSSALGRKKSPRTAVLTAEQEAQLVAIIDGGAPKKKASKKAEKVRTEEPGKAVKAKREDAAVEPEPAPKKAAKPEPKKPEPAPKKVLKKKAK